MFKSLSQFFEDIHPATKTAIAATISGMGGAVILGYPALAGLIVFFPAWLLIHLFILILVS